MPNNSNSSQNQSTFSIFTSLTGTGAMPGSSSTNPLGIGIPSSMASGSGNGQSSMGTSNIGSGTAGSPGSIVNGPVRVGMNPHLGQERRTGDVSSAFADMPQAVSKVS
jgi:hypothetical protein